MAFNRNIKRAEHANAHDVDRIQCASCPYQVTTSAAFACKAVFCPARSVFRKLSREQEIGAAQM